MEEKETKFRKKEEEEEEERFPDNAVSLSNEIKSTSSNNNTSYSIHLLSFPQPLLWEIIFYLEAKDVASFSSTCRYLFHLCKESTLWEHFCQIILNRSSQSLVKPITFSWKNYFIHLFTFQKRIVNFRCLARYESHSNFIISMAYDGERLYTGAKDWKIFIWDVSDPRYVDALPTSTIHLNAIPRGLLRSGDILYVGDSNGDLYAYLIPQNQLSTDPVLIEKLEDAHQHSIFSLACYKDFLFSTSIGSIKVWNKINFKLIKELQNDIQGLGEIWTSCLSDRYFMAAGSTGKVLIFSLSSFELIHVISFPNFVRCGAVANNKLFTGDDKGIIQLWDLDSFQCIKTIKEHKDVVQCQIVIDEVLLSCGGDSTVIVYDLKKDKVIKSLFDAEAWINRLIIAGSVMFSGGGDYLLKLWGEETESERAQDPMLEYLNMARPIFMKKDRVLFSWSKCWAILKEGIFYIFNNENSLDTPKLLVVIDDRWKIIEKDLTISKKYYSFELTNGIQSFIFGDPSHKNTLSWCYSLKTTKDVCIELNSIEPPKEGDSEFIQAITAAGLDSPQIIAELNHLPEVKKKKIKQIYRVKNSSLLDPEALVALLKNREISETFLNNILKQLKLQDVAWLQQFIKVAGFNGLVDTCESLFWKYHETLKKDLVNLIAICLECIYCLLVNSKVKKFPLSGSIDNIALCMTIPEQNAQSLSLKILTLICEMKPLGYNYSLDAITSIKLFLENPHRFVLWVHILQEKNPNYDLVFQYIHFLVVALNFCEKDDLLDLQQELISSKIINVIKELLPSLENKPQTESLKKEIQEFIQITERKIQRSSTIEESEQTFPTSKSVEEPLLQANQLAKTQVYYNYLATQELYHLNLDYTYEGENYSTTICPKGEKEGQEANEYEYTSAEEYVYDYEIYKKRKEASNYLNLSDPSSKTEERENKEILESREAKTSIANQSILVNQSLPLLPDVKSGLFFIRSGKLFKSWKQIMLVLENQILIIYGDKQKQIKITQLFVKEVISVDIIGTVWEKSNCFKLGTKDQTFILSCQNQNEMEDWIFNILAKGFIDMDWNEEFQKICEAPNTLIHEKAEKIGNLASQFASVAFLIGKIIIEEVHSPVKKISPSQIGGIAGGKKFFQNGIFFKFAQDDHGLYGGDEFAMKASTHELKGLTAYVDYTLNSRFPIRLCFPLMAIIDYRGWRLTAVSVLPVGLDTLVYGTANARQTIYDKSKEVSAMMKKAARGLNIKPHWVWDLSGTKKVFIAGPGDIEVHKGRDNRFYVLDCARVFPPTEPLPNKKKSFLYNLFRPEFIRNYHTPLCSDAFCVFGKDPSDPTVLRSYNIENSKATSYLELSVIPKFTQSYALFLNSIYDSNYFHRNPTAANETDFQELLRLFIIEMHQNGINVRYLGKIRNCNFNKEMMASRRAKGFGLYLFVTSKIIDRIILLEMIARVAKNRLRKLLRNSTNENLNKVICKFIRDVINSGTVFWNNSLKQEIADIFGGLSPTESSPSHQLQTGISILDLFQRLCFLTKLKFNGNIQKKLMAGGTTFTQEEVEEDFIEMLPKIKQMPYTILLKALSLYKEAVEGEMAKKNILVKLDLLEKAYSHYLNYLETKTDDSNALMMIANVLRDLLKAKESCGKLTASLKFFHIYFIDHFYSLSCENDFTNVNNWKNYISFLEETGINEEKLKELQEKMKRLSPHTDEKKNFLL